MAEERVTSGKKEATKKHREDPLVVLLSKVEWALEQLALLDAEEQRQRPAQKVSAPEPPQPSARQAAATPAFSFFHQNCNKRARVHPIQESLLSVSPLPATEMK